MKKKLTLSELIIVSSMLFGMFFGAGNLIFPAMLGKTAGAQLLPAFVGLFITATGLPLLAVAALGISRSEGVLDLSSKVGRGYGVFFTTLLYLTIGPLFAIPRCAGTSFSVGAAGLIGGMDKGVALAIFSFLFFAVALFFSLRPSGITVWIGKILNPVFLVFLGVLIVAALCNPAASVADVLPSAEYATPTSSFFSGFLEGYNTLDALAGLAFGIVVIEVVRSHGVTEPEHVAANTAKAGTFSCLFMGVVYFFLTLVSAQSAPFCEKCQNGGEVLGSISSHFFGQAGGIMMTAIVGFACLKTAIGLITSCAETFVRMFPKGPSYRWWAVIFSVVSFGIANFGLTSIVAYCVPVLMFLYPLAITLILLALCGKFFENDRAVYVATTAATLVAAVFDFLSALASTLRGSGVATPTLDAVSAFGKAVLPLSSLGLGWVCPAAVGFLIGIAVHLANRKKA